MALLEQRALLRLPGKETFVVAELFKVGSKIGGRILSAIGWNFSKQFLSVTEKHVPETEIAAWTYYIRQATNGFLKHWMDSQVTGRALSLTSIVS